MQVIVSFLTDAHAAQHMKQELLCFHETHLNGLRSYIKQQHIRRASHQSASRRSLDRCMSRVEASKPATCCKSDRWSSAPPLQVPGYTLRQNSDDSSGSQTNWSLL